jgi:hypothetical protein
VATASPVENATPTPTAPPEKLDADAPKAPGWVTFITDNRRQTEQMPKQMYALLPEKIKGKWGYVFCGNDIPPTKNILLFDNYTGFQDTAVYPDWAQERHNNTIACIEGILKKYPERIITLQVTQGDSTNRAFALEIRKKLQERQDAITDKYRINRANITFGADEQAIQAMAYSLGPVEVDIIVSNPDAGQHYDGDRPAKELIAAKLGQIGLVQKAGAPFRVLVFTRRPGGGIVDWQADDKAQQIFDQTFIEQNPITKDTAIVDARLYNGAWDSTSAPKRCDYLAYGGWGTFGNSFGQTASIAKILYKLKADRKQFILEAVAHDVFFQGYNDAQRRGFRDIVEKAGYTYMHYDEYSWENAKKIYVLLNDYVNKRMTDYFKGTGCFDGKKILLTPQRPALFEAISELK